MQNFDEVYDGMNKDYAALERLMSDIYSREGNSDMIMALGEIAKRMIDTQITFTESYCQDSMKEALISNLTSKGQALTDALSKGKTK